MKWYEVAVDCGDGTTTRNRFRTFKEAKAWRDKQEDNEYFQQDGDGSPVIPVDTESNYFYYDPTEDD